MSDGPGHLQQRQVHVSDHLLRLYIRSDIDVMKNDRCAAGRFLALRQPGFIEIRGGLVVRPGTHVPCPGATLTWNDPGFDAVRIRTDVFGNGKVEIDAVFGRRCSARIGVVQPITAMLLLVEKTIFQFPGNQLANGLVFEFRWPAMLDAGYLCFGELDDVDVHIAKIFFAVQ